MARSKELVLDVHDRQQVVVSRERRPLEQVNETNPSGPVRTAADARRRGEVAYSHGRTRSEEHTSELQSLTNLVCRLLLEKKKKKKKKNINNKTKTQCR